MFLNDLDPHFIKSLNYLYASDNIARGEPLPLQFYLEDAIKNKMGIAKDFSSIVAASMKHRRVNDFVPYINTLEESNGSSSDKELELDLLKADLMCIICNGMEVGARNQLLECTDCHMLYHQECHKPIVPNLESFDTWVCQNCKDASKKIKLNSVSPVSSTLPKISSTPSKSSSQRHGNLYKSSTDSKPEKYSKNSSSKSSKLSSNGSTSSRTNVTPNINIISADKRIQIMKKKAAKLQEKRLTRVPR